MTEEPKPTENFLAYVAPLTVGESRDHIPARWTGLLAFANDATVADVDALVDAVFGKTSAVETAAPAPLLEALATADELFVPSGRAREIQLLCAAALDRIFTLDSVLDKRAVTGVVGAAFGGRSATELPLDIVARAAAEIDSIAMNRRDRSSIAATIGKLGAPPEVNAAAPIKTFRDSKDLEHAALAMEAIVVSTNAAVAKSHKASKAAIEALLASTQSLEEESEVQWWAFNGRSRDLEVKFTEVDAPALIFVAAKELADKTTVSLDRRTAKAILSHCGVGDSRTAVADAVNGAPSSWIKQWVEGHQSATRTPLSRALHRRVDIGDDRAWSIGWASATGIPADFSATALDISLAFYLERMHAKAGAG